MEVGRPILNVNMLSPGLTIRGLYAKHCNAGINSSLSVLTADVTGIASSSYCCFDFPALMGCGLAI